jgi:sulfur transfer protein SufE
LSNSNSWENKTLPEFLEALSAYTKKIQGCYDNMHLNANADEANCSTFADIFKGAAIYE